MRGRKRGVRQVVGVLAIAPILLSVAAPNAMAVTEVRFLHAVPGAPDARLELSSDRVPAEMLPAAGFAKETGYGEVPAGMVTLTLSAGEQRLARASKRLEDGARYTAVAVPGGEAAQLRVYRDGEAQGSTARWRMVHAAPEIDAAEAVIDGRGTGLLDPGDATDYESVEPGPHRLALSNPKGEGPLVQDSDVALVAGTAQTAYVVGSGGEPTRFVVLEDDAATPTAAPDTGLGGFSQQPAGGNPWLAALAAAVLAGTLGGVLHARRGHGHA